MVVGADEADSELELVEAFAVVEVDPLGDAAAEVVLVLALVAFVELAVPTPMAPAMSAVAAVAPTAVQRLIRRTALNPRRRGSLGSISDGFFLFMSAPVDWGGLPS